MNGNVIQVNYEQLEAIAGRFGQMAEENETLRANVTRGVDALRNGGWEGEGANTFLAEMDGMMFPAVERLINALEEAQKVTLEIVRVMREAEEEAARPFRNGSSSTGNNTSGEQLPVINPDEWVNWVNKKVDSLRDKVGDIIDKGSDLLNKAEFLARKLAAVQWSDIVDTEGLKGDWLNLFAVWFFETKPSSLGVWGEKNDTPIVTITDPNYIDDLKNKPNYAEAIQALKTKYPNLKVGDSIRHPFRFTGPGTTTGEYNALEWFLGSYSTTITVTAVDPVTGQATVDVQVLNLSHWESGTRMPQQFQDIGIPEFLIPDAPRGDFGPGGNFYQEFVWQDTIRL
ncbi:MAG TPA: WXG100 family type VII secretion target [Anaerolineae bacterium]|nr:WXG100 family type VII secretion target [Anaerolineae bacterium]